MSIFTPFHSLIFSDYFDIDPHATSDFELNNLKFEIKEAQLRKFNKNYCYVNFTLKQKDFMSHDFFIFLDREFQDYYLTSAHEIDNILKSRKFSNSTSITLSKIKQISIHFNSIEKLYDYIKKLKRVDVK